MKAISKRSFIKTMFGLTLVIVFLFMGGFFSTPVAHAVASTIQEAGDPPAEMLSSATVPAKAGAVIPTTTFLLGQSSGSATLNSVTVAIVDPNASGLASADIASVSLRRELGSSGFQVGEDLLVAGASANTPAVDGSPIVLTPTTPEAIDNPEQPVQYYIVITIAASPTNNHSLAVNLGANYGIDNSGGTVGTALNATKKVTIDTTPPSNPTASDYRISQNTPGTADLIMVKPGVSVGVAGDTVKIYAANGTTLLGSGTLGGAPNVQFDPIDIGDNTNASVKVEFVDPAGNASGQVAVTGNDIVAPTATVTAYTDRIIIQFSEQVDGMMVMNCANYRVGGAALNCGGMGLPFVDFQGTKATIKGLNLSGTTSLVISESNTITDINGHNPLTAYSNNALTVNTLVLPTISSFNETSGAVGDSLTITGNNFGADPGGSHTDKSHKVFFSGGNSQTTGPLPPIEATSFTSWSNTSIVVTVPVGTQSGPVNVMVDGVMSDMNQHSFFDIATSYVAKIYYDAETLMPDSDKNNIRIVVGGQSGPVVHYNGDGTTTYDADTDEFTIMGVSSMGWTWAYDITGAHLNSQGQQVDVTTTQNHILTATSRKISGTITLGSSCVNAGKNQNVVIFAMPEEVDTGGNGFKSMDPAFFKTNSSCTVNYSVGIPTNGIYRVEANIMPDVSSSTVGSAAYTTPDALSVTISDSAPTATSKNFTFLAATHRIVGTVRKPSGSFGGDERGMLFVFAYQPRENGKGTGTQVAEDGTFTLYVTPGTWKVGVGGGNMNFPIEVQVDVDDTYLIAADPKGPTIVIAPPSDFIEGYVKDSAGNGLANASLYAWLEGGPGGGNAQTDSQGYYKMYVTPGSNYHVGANSQTCGFLGEQSNIAVTSSTHPIVNFNVSASDNFTISGTVTKNTVALQQAFVFITEGKFGPMLGSGGTASDGTYTVKVSGGANRYLHIGLPGKGEVYGENLGTIAADDTSKDIAITSSTIKVRISPASSFTQAFVGVHSNQDGGFSDTDVATGDPGYREYQIDIRRPGSGSTTYYMDGGIPGYGPLPQGSVVVNSNGTFVETSGTTNDGIIEITLGGLYTVEGTVTGDNVRDAWVFASGPNGGSGGAVAADGAYSIQLRDGTYDISVGKPGYIGNKISATVNGANLPAQNLVLTTATDTITGKVYLPDGVTVAVNAQVWAEDGNGGWAGGSTDASGNYTLSVSAGSWTVKSAYDGYNSNATLVTAPATGKNITLIAVAGFASNLKNAPITTSDGGIVRGTGIKVDFPKNALGTGNTAGTVEVKSTTNVVTKNDRKLVGTSKEITARNSSNQNITTLSGSITIELTLSRAELEAADLTFAQAQAIKITYYDSTAGSWSEIPTVVTLSVPTATTIAELDADPAITLTGTVTHLSTFAPSLPTDADAPATPTGFNVSAGNTTAALSWTASAGATKYDVYKKVGDDYTYLAQTTSVSYSATGLTNGTVYYFKVSALDDSDRESAATSEASVTPRAAVTGGGGGGAIIISNAPIISNISSTVTKNQAVIKWTTSASSISWLLYGLTTAYGQESKTNVYVTNHEVTLNNLASDTTYHFAVKSQNAYAAVGTYSDQIFKTIGATEQTTTTTTASTAKTITFKELKLGSSGASVINLQDFLIKEKLLVIPKGIAKGTFAPLTEKALKKFQQANGLPATGVLNTATQAVISLKSLPKATAVELEGKVVKALDSAAIYLIKDGVKKPFTSEMMFFSYGHKWADVATYDLSEIVQGDNMVYSDDHTFTGGQMLKGADEKVYFIDNAGKRHWVKDEATFLGLGYKWNQVAWISNTALAKYTAGDDIATATVRPDGSLVKYAGSDKVYLLEDGKKRWIKTEIAFNAHKYGWYNIILAPAVEQYADGDDLVE